MLTLVKTDTTFLYKSSTRGLGDEFRMILTNTGNLNTFEIDLTVDERTARYDRFTIDESVINTLDDGWYDFVIVEKDFSGTYDNTSELISKYNLVLVEIGKLKVLQPGLKKITEYNRETVQIKDYEPEEI